MSNWNVDDARAAAKAALEGGDSSDWYDRLRDLVEALEQQPARAQGEPLFVRVSAQRAGPGEDFVEIETAHGNGVTVPSTCAGRDRLIGPLFAHPPTSANQGGVPEGWKPAHRMSNELPEIGKPVLGYHPEWVDADFCADGIRECYLYGDGSEWQSARWDGYSDQWIVEDGAPQLWQEHPQPPMEGE